MAMRRRARLTVSLEPGLLETLELLAFRHHLSPSVYASELLETALVDLRCEMQGHEPKLLGRPPVTTVSD